MKRAVNASIFIFLVFIIFGSPINVESSQDTLLPVKEIAIVHKEQQNKFDCGQTVLDMLGYDGHKMFPTGQVTSNNLRSISGTRELTLPVGREEEINYDYPKIWIVLGKGIVKGKMHWAIRHKETIYCPTRGVMSVEEYKQRYVAYVLQTFEVPVKGQLTPEEYYQQFPPERRPKYLNKQITEQMKSTKK